MKLGVETPDASSTSRGCRSTASRSRRAAACASARPSATATWPPHRARPRALPAARAVAAVGRVRAAAQHRDDRRQPAPAHALRLLPGRLEAVQQAPPRLGLPGARGRPPQPRDPRPLGRVRRDAPVRHGRRRWPRSAPRSTSPAGRASGRSRSRACTACPATTRSATPSSSAGELVTAVELEPLAPALAAHSTYRKVRDRASFSFAVVSVAAALDVDGRHRPRLPDRARRRRPRPVARVARGGGAARRAGDGGALRRGRRGRARPGRSRCATTRSRSRSPGTCSPSTLASLAGGGGVMATTISTPAPVGARADRGSRAARR